MDVPGTWPKRILFIVGIIFLASYYNLLSLTPVDEALAYLANRSHSTALFDTPSGRGEALYVVFAFLFLTPIAGMFAFLLPLFISAVFAEFMRRALHVPEGYSTLAFFSALGAAAWMTREAWVPGAEWFISVLAGALLVGFSLGS